MHRIKSGFANPVVRAKKARGETLCPAGAVGPLRQLHPPNPMANKDFFEESREQSQVKTSIVSKYFYVWAKVVIPTTKNRSNRIAYIDLFAGPGRYDDGQKSTPLCILELAIKDADLCKMLVSLFNDGDSDKTRSLETAINELPKIELLTHKPIVENREVGEKGENIVNRFEKNPLVPTLFFVDPWGYKGLSLRLINSVLKDWGCDCIFFFNYNRINAGIHNKSVNTHIDALFGAQRAEELRYQLKSALYSPAEREWFIINSLTDALREMGGEFVLTFRFLNDQGTRTSHHLVFVTKHVKGHDIMKSIMAKESTGSQQGVPTFEYNPKPPDQFDLFARPLDQLTKILLTEFAGQTLTMLEIYERHNGGTPYISANYKDALLILEETQAIVVQPPAPMRSKRNGKITFGDAVKVTFPRKH